MLWLAPVLVQRKNFLYENSFNLCFGFFLRTSRPLAVRLYSFGARRAHLHLFSPALFRAGKKAQK